MLCPHKAVFTIEESFVLKRDSSSYWLQQTLEARTSFPKQRRKGLLPRGICEFWGTLHSVPGYKCLLKSHHLLRYLKAWLEASVLLLYVKFPHRVGQAPSHSDLMTYFLIKIISVLSKAWGLKMLPSSMPGTVHMVKTHSQGGHRTKENIFILFF